MSPPLDAILNQLNPVNAHLFNTIFPSMLGSATRSLSYALYQVSLKRIWPECKSIQVNRVVVY